MKEEILNKPNYTGENLVIKENMMFAKKLANRFYKKRSHSQAEIEDMVASAYLGLCEAANRFNKEKSDSFKSYSFLRIRGSMYEYLKLNGGISRHSYKKLSNNQGNCEYFANKNHVQGFNINQIADLNAMTDSLGIFVHHDKLNNEYEISYSKQDQPEETLEKKEDNGLIRLAVNELPYDVKRVIQARYFEDKSLADLQIEFPEYSKSYISRLHTKGLRLLKEKLQKNIQ